MLRSNLFRDVPRLQDAARNAPPIRGRESDYGVAMLQAGLMQLGYRLPASTRRHGAPDGIYGAETREAIVSFQAGAKLKADGVAGHDTLHAIDARLPATKPPGPAPRPAPKPEATKPHRLPPPIEPFPNASQKHSPGPKPSPRMPVIPPGSRRVPPLVPGGHHVTSRLPLDDHYEEGTAPPPFTADQGAGAWNSEPVSVATRAGMVAIKTPQFWGAALIATGPHSVVNLKHYFANTGADLTIDYAAMKAASFEGQRAYDVELTNIVRYIDSCQEGRWGVRSKALHTSEFTYNYPDATRDWFFAVGGYSLWTIASCDIRADGTIAADIFVHVFDRYNWDGGKSVTIAGMVVTDERMGAFHRQGQAREFNMHGSAAVKRVQWPKGEPPRFDTFKH